MDWLAEHPEGVNDLDDDGEAVRIAKKSTERYLGRWRGGVVRYARGCPSPKQL